MTDNLTHFNASGEAHMVDVSEKNITKRQAVAEGRIVMQPDTLKLIQAGGHKKRGVLGISRGAGIMGGKKKPPIWCRCATRWR